MGDHDNPATCLSASYHGPKAVRDITEHYFGCLEISERPKFLSRTENKELWDHFIDIEEQMLRQQEGYKTPPEILREKAERKVKQKILRDARSIEETYKRTDILRKALSDARCPRVECPEAQAQKADNSEPSKERCNLVNCVVESHEAWKQDPEFRKGIKKIRDWKNTIIGPVQSDNFNSNLSNSSTIDMDPGREAVRSLVRTLGATDTFEEDPKAYELERDIKGHIIQWDVVENESDRTSTNLTQSSGPTMPDQKNEDSQSDKQSTLPGPQPTESRYESKPPAERYLKPADENAPGFKGHFPDQSISLRYLLHKPTSEEDKYDILCRDRPEDRIRYVHIPYNNMKWVEEAIARYFGETRPNYDGIFRKPGVKTHSQMVLRPEYWKGQQHGGRRTLVHARHMRPICERVSSEIWDSEDNPKNLVLFMPFLHWEEDRKRDKIAKIIEERSERHRAELEKNEEDARKKRIEDRTFNGGMKLKSTRKPPEPDTKVDEAHRRRVNKAWKKNAFGKTDAKHERTFTGLAEGLTPTGPIKDEKDEKGRKLWYVAKLECDDHGRMRARSALGQFLLDAARLYEAMSIYRDQQLLEEYLHHDPPLHPRRTLDQSYYWTLKTTKARDRDQVVYRGTKMDDRNVHRFREHKEDKCKGKPFRLPWADRQDAEESESTSPSSDSNFGRYKWDNHWMKAGDNKKNADDKCEHTACDHCRSEVRKVSRVVMVDQLWMWILDKKTIITSFPKRYGTNKQDASGVHKSVRNRIKTARKNQIRSVFDVALIILDECSNTFFDRTKTPDRQPQVMDIFAESIGTLTNKQTVSFQHLWHWTKRAANVYNSKAKWAHEDASQLHFPLLNINPEGKLQREIKDIIDELDIMIHVNNKQREVIRRFTKHVENIYDPTGEWRDESISPDGERDYISQGRRKGNQTTQDKVQDKRERDEFNWFRRQAYELISDVGDRITELEGLRKSAESTSQGIKDLLDLKQQQASILQAWQSVKQADESVRQGRSIMIFTIVTIIFLPLSFMSSVFGMNNSNFGDNHMSFSNQASYMFSISTAVILVSIIFAFWTFPRTAIWSTYKLLETWLLVNTGAYRLWLFVLENIHILKSDVLLKKLEEKVEKMKGEVRKQHWDREMAKKRRKEKKEDKNAEDQRRGQQNGQSSLSSIDRQPEGSESATTDTLHMSFMSLLRKGTRTPDSSPA